jgi:hypothetical protein
MGLFCCFEGRRYDILREFYISDYESHFRYIWHNFTEEDKNTYVPSLWYEISDGSTIRHFSLIRMGELNYFGDYFYTIQEERSLKILKIEDRL